MVWWNPDWTVLTKVKSAHGSYIFAAAHNVATAEVVTAGDEGIVKVWKLVVDDNGSAGTGDDAGSGAGAGAGAGGGLVAVECVESIGMPGEVYALSVHQATGDVAVACTDGVARVFTRDPVRYARATPSL